MQVFTDPTSSSSGAPIIGFAFELRRAAHDDIRFSYARKHAMMTTCRALQTEIDHSHLAAAHLLQAVLKEAFVPAS